MRMNINAPKFLPTQHAAFWGGQLILAVTGGLFLALWLLIFSAMLDQQAAERHAAELRAQEEALMKEFDCMRLTLFWESKRHDETDMTEIARNIMTRVDSPKYPNTICGVVNEVRQKPDGTKVPMYSYIFDNRPRPAENHRDWKLAGRVTHKVMLAHAEGRLEKGAINYHAPYVSPVWAKRGVERCLLEQMETNGYHLFYAEVPRSERKKCLAERAMAQGVPVPTKKPQAKGKIATSELAFVPVPKERPKSDAIAAIIAAN